MPTGGSALEVKTGWLPVMSGQPARAVIGRQEAGSSQYHSNTFHMLLTTKGFCL